MSEDSQAAVCFDVVRAFETHHLLKRSATLEGTISLRAAQGCKPFLEGNAAGFHVRLQESAVLKKTATGAELQMTDEALAIATEGYEDRVESLVRHGHLHPDRYWHRELLKGFTSLEDGFFRVWTGLLIRPVEGVCILVSTALNRRCQVKIREYVIPDGSGFVPLVLQFDLASLRQTETWLDVEIACLTPLRPGVVATALPIRERPGIGRAFSDFYSPHYFDPRSRGENAGTYRKIAREPLAEEASGDPKFDLVVAGPFDIHRIRTFDRFATEAGWVTNHVRRNQLPYAELGCLTGVSARFDGIAPRDISVDTEADAEALRKEWAGLFGDAALESIEQWIAYVHANQGPVSEPYVIMQPWVLAAAAPGWSALLESYDLKGMEGMRGITSADTFHGILPIWHLRYPGEFEISRGSALARIIPVPRSLLKAGFHEVPIT